MFAQVDFGIAPPLVGVNFLAMNRDGAKDVAFQQEEIAEVASQIRVAFAKIVLNTGSCQVSLK